MDWKGKSYYTAVDGGDILQLPNPEVWVEQIRRCHRVLAAYYQGSFDTNVLVNSEAFGPRWQELGETIGYFPSTPEPLTNSGYQGI